MIAPTASLPDISVSAASSERPAGRDPASLRRRVEALTGHELGVLLQDQLHVLRRIEEDPAGLFAPVDPLGTWNDALTAWERRHLRAQLGEWLDVIEANELAAATPADERPRLDVRSFGATGDGRTNDGPALRRAVAALSALDRPATLVIPAGRYHLGDLQESRSHLVLRGLADVIVEGEPGAELLGQGSAAVLRFEGCRNVRVRHLTCDYDPPLASEADILSVNHADKSLLCRLDPGAIPPSDLAQGRDYLGASTFDSEGRMHLPQHGLRAVSWENVEAGVWRLRLAGPDIAGVGAGDRIVLFHRCKWSQAVVVSQSSWIDLADFAIHGAPEFALYIESCTGVSVRRSRVTPRPGRLGGLNADGIHARSNRYGPFFVGCDIRRVQDDCFNLQSRMVSVIDVFDERTLVLDLPWDAADRVGYWQPYRGDYAPGDMLAFVSPTTGELAGWAAIAGAVAHDWRGHRRVLATLDRPVAGLVSREALGKTAPVMSSSEYLDVTREASIEHFVLNASTKCDGFVIRDCDFGNNSVTGGKIKAGNGLIVNNRSARHGWCVWSFATEMVWQEGYAARRVLVQGNHHVNWFGIYTGSQYPLGRSHVGVPLHYRIDIVGNTLVGHGRGEYAVDLNGAVGCTILDNILPADRPLAISPTCRHVRVDGNREG